MIPSSAFWRYRTKRACSCAMTTDPVAGKSPGKPLCGDEKDENIHVGNGKTKAEFVAFRTARDEQLAMPKLIVPSLQVNMKAGSLPQEDDNGMAYFKVPINQL